MGAGITGLVTALLLQREGLGVTLIDQHRVGTGVTGYTTGKLARCTSSSTRSSRTHSGSRRRATYAEANEAGLARLADLVEELAIDCDFRRRTNYTYAASADDLPKIEAEVDAAAAAGLDASFVSDVPLPFPTAGAIRVPHQAEFHPVRFTAALAAALVGGGGRIFERTRALKVDDGEPCVVRTSRRRGQRPPCRPRHATSRSPTAASTSRACTPSAPTASAAPLEGEPPEGMFISASSPTRSIRFHPEAGRELVHRRRRGPPRRPRWPHRSALRPPGELRARALRLRPGHSPLVGAGQLCSGRRAARRKADATLTAHLGGHRVPQVGARDGSGGRAADHRRDRRPREPLAELLRLDQAHAESPQPRRSSPRTPPRASTSSPTASPAGARTPPRTSPPAKDEIASRHGRQVALSRGDDGTLHAVSARCTHLGCIVAWNDAEQTWDCPCHASRFAPDGSVLQGPAVHPLAQRQP